MQSIYNTPAIMFALVVAAFLAGCSGGPATSSTGSIGCEQATPCEMVVSVDDTGIVEVSHAQVTAGDWYKIEVSNDGDAEHTVTLSGVGASWTVPSLDDRASVVQFPARACLQFASGSTTAKLSVYAADYVDVSQGAATETDPCA